MSEFNWQETFFHELVKDEEDHNKKSEMIQHYFKNNDLDINTEYDGFTCLHYACAQNLWKVVLNLIYDYKDKLNLDAITSFNETALQIAIRQNNNSIVQLLLKSGANPNLRRDGDGKTAIHLSVQYSIVTILETLLNQASTEVNATDNEDFTALHYAVQGNEWYKVLLLLEHGADPNAQNNDGKTPLHLLVNDGQTTIGSSLLTHGALLDIPDNTYFTPLHTAVTVCNEAAVELFLANGADPDYLSRTKQIIHSALEQDNLNIFSMILKATKYVDAMDTNLLTPLQKAVKENDEEKVKLLLEHGANSNIKWKKSNTTLLLFSVEIGNINITNLLLQHQAVSSIDVKSKKGLTPLITAVISNRADYISLLLKHGADVNVKNKEERTSLHLACESNNLEMVKLLCESEDLQVDLKDKHNYTALHIAFKWKNDAIVKLLLSARADPSILHPQSGFTSLHEAVNQNSIDVVEILLKCNETDVFFSHANKKQQRTDEQYRVKNVSGTDAHAHVVFPGSKIPTSIGNIELLKLLLFVPDSDMNKLKYEQTTPLLMGIETEYGNTVKFLISCGCNCNMNEKIKKRTKPTTINNTKMAERLYYESGVEFRVFDSGENPFVQRNEYLYPFINFAVNRGNSKMIGLILSKNLDILEEYRINLNNCDYSDNYKLTPLHLAVRNGDMESMKVLLEYGSNPNLGDINGKFPLHYPLDVTMMELLIECGADVNAKDRNLRSPLHFAVQRGDVDLVTLLLKHGASPNDGDKWRETPLHVLIEPFPLLSADELKNLHTILSIISSQEYIYLNPTDPQRLEKAHSIMKIILKDTEINLNAEDMFYRTPLSLAVQHNRLDLVILLLKHNADPTVSNIGKGDTLLHSAINLGGSYMLSEQQLSSNLAVPNERKGESLLHSAIGLGNSYILRELLEYGAHVKINSLDFHNSTPLVMSIYKNDLMSVRVLLEYEPDVNVQCDDKCALIIAIEQGNHDIITHLLDVPSININTIGMKNPLLLAVGKNYLDIVRRLIQLGADPNQRGARERTPLHIAAKNQNLQIILCLVRMKNILINAEDDSKLTPLHLALEMKDIDESVIFECVYTLIVYGADVNRPCALGNTAIHLAAITGFGTFFDAILKVQIVLIDLPNKDGNTPLHLACCNLQHNVVKKIVMVKNQSVTATNLNGKTPPDLYLHHLIRNDVRLQRQIMHQETIQGVAKTVIEKNIRKSKVTVEILLHFNKTMKWFDAQYLSSLLYLAVESQGVDLTSALLDQGANVNYRTAIKFENVSNSSLCLAQRNDVILKLLMGKEDCEVNFPDSDGKTVLHYAVQEERDNIGQILRLLNYGAYPDALDSEGKTPLFYTTNLQKIKLLLEFGAEPFIKDKKGKIAEFDFLNNPIRHLIARAAFKRGFFNDFTEIRYYMYSLSHRLRSFIDQCLQNLHKCSLRIDDHLEEKFEEDITYNDILTENYQKIHVGNIQNITKIMESKVPRTKIPWFSEYLKIRFHILKQNLPIVTPIGKSNVKLRDFFTADPDQMAKYLEVQDVAHFLRSTKMITHTKWYSCELNQKIQSGNKVHDIRNKISRNPHASCILQKLPPECIELILRLLSFRDIIVLDEVLSTPAVCESCEKL